MTQPTSIKAYHEMKDSGKIMQKHRNILMTLGTVTESLTATEIDERFEKLTEVKNLRAHKSMRELERLGRVAPFNKRTCRITGKTAITWQLSDYVDPEDNVLNLFD